MWQSRVEIEIKFEFDHITTRLLNFAKGRAHMCFIHSHVAEGDSTVVTDVLRFV